MKKLAALSLVLFVFVTMTIYAQDAKKESIKSTSKCEAKKDSSKCKGEKMKACTDKKMESKKDTVKKEAPKKN